MEVLEVSNLLFFLSERYVNIKNFNLISKQTTRQWRRWPKSTDTTLRYVHSVNRKNEVVAVSQVVSLGTGIPSAKELQGIGIFLPDSYDDVGPLTRGVTAIKDVVLDQVTLTDGIVVDQARAWCSTLGSSYFRFNPPMTVDVPLNETNIETVTYLLVLFILFPSNLFLVS